MRKMYDSVAPAAIPRDAQMVAGYVDGRYAWSKEDWGRFPNATKVTISAIGTALAHVVDVEVGCVWPPERAVPWVRRARAAGIDPTVYVNERNDWGPTKRAFDAAGEPHPHWWVANYDNRAGYLPPGAVARQYANEPLAGGHYDLSTVADYWPGVDEEDDVRLDDTVYLEGGGTIDVAGALRAAVELRNMFMRTGGLPSVTGEQWTSGADLLIGAHAHARWTDARTAAFAGQLATIAERPDVTPEELERITNDAVQTAQAQQTAELKTHIDSRLADVDEEALAAAMQARGIGGANVAEVKAAFAEVLRGGVDAVPTAEEGD